MKNNYIDGFVLPIAREHLDEYQAAASAVAAIYREHGATAYFEFVGDDLFLEGTKSFTQVVDSKPDEVIVFGWAVYESRETRDLVNERVAADPRMTELVDPLMHPDKQVFDPSRMAYGGFRPLVY